METTLVELALRFVGAFYIFAGYIVARITLMTAFLERAEAAGERKLVPAADRVRNGCLLVTSALVLVGGVLLLLLVDRAEWAFLVSLLWQFAYIYVIAPRWIDGTSAPDAVGRRQNVNAFVVYCAAAFFVMWAARKGYLRPLQDLTPNVVAIAALMLGAYVVYIVRGLRR